MRPRNKCCWNWKLVLVSPPERMAGGAQRLTLKRWSLSSDVDSAASWWRLQGWEWAGKRLPLPLCLVLSAGDSGHEELNQGLRALECHMAFL